MASGILLQSLADGVLWDSQGNALNGHPVYVYLRSTTTQVTVYQDAALTTPLSQPLATGTLGAGPGGVPGYVAGGQDIDFYDATTTGRAPAEPLLASSVVSDSSHVDLIGLGAAPGQDITTVLQNAINAKVVSGAGVTISTSNPGSFNVNGAITSGTISGRPYAGQILLPAFRWDTQTPPVVSLKGLVGPQIYNSIVAQGFVLLSNATSGNVVSVIPPGAGPYPGYSALLAAIEDLAVICPTNTQAGGLDLSNAIESHVERVVLWAPLPGGGVTGLTGAGPGLALPFGTSNGGWNIVRDVGITGFPVGIVLGDHSLLMGNVYITSCGVALEGQNSESCYLERVFVLSCPTALKPTSTLTLTGHMGWEPGAVTSCLLVDDAIGLAQGHLILQMVGDSPVKPQSLPAKMGNASGGSALNLSRIWGDAGGWAAQHPIDTFLRLLPSSDVAGYPGLCSDTLHPWRLNQGTFSISQSSSNGTLTSTAGGGNAQAFVPVKHGLYGGESRSVSFIVTTGSSYNVTFYAQRVFGGTQNGKAITVQLQSGVLYLMVNNSVMAQSGAGAIVASTTYTVSTLVTVGSFGLPTRARVFLNGVQSLDYYLTAAQQVSMVSSGGIYPFLEDGILFQGDTLSTITGMVVRPVSTDDPFVTNGKATLAAGTTGSIANTNITALSLIRVWRTTAGGTLGDLSYTLSAGVGFTINSSSGTDTSGIYYEIVSY